MSGQLPELVEPLLLADQDTILEGSLPLAGCERLREFAPPEGLVRTRLHFRTDEGGRPLLAGSFSTTLKLQCQRCLEPMSIPLNGEFRVFLVKNLEEADRLADSMDVLQVGRRAVPLKKIVEDEVLLAVPPAPLHPHGKCSAAARLEQDARDVEQEREQRPNPVAVLATLKQNHDR